MTDHLQVLRGILEAEADRVEGTRRDLIRARDALHNLALSGDTGRGRVVTLMSDGDAASTVVALNEETVGLIRTCVMILDEGPAFDPDAHSASLNKLRSGRPQHAIYPMAALNSANGRQIIESWGEVGEQQRFLTATANEFAVYDSAVLTLAEWGDPGSGYVLIREPVVVSAFAGFFDLQWALAVPLADSGTDLDQRLVELLSLGLKDEAIARQLGLGLRTVRRRVAGLMDQHGVETRFQLGLAVGREQTTHRPGRWRSRVPR